MRLQLFDSTLSLAIACAAMPMLSAADEKSISGREFMTVNAMRRARADTTPDILRGRYRLKMGGIDALRITAKMVDMKTFTDLPYEQFVGDSMGHTRFATNPELAIAMAKGRGPVPATGRQNLRTVPVNFLQEKSSLFIS